MKKISHQYKYEYTIIYLKEKKCSGEYEIRSTNSIELKIFYDKNDYFIINSLFIGTREKIEVCII